LIKLLNFEYAKILRKGVQSKLDNIIKKNIIRNEVLSSLDIKTYFDSTGLYH
jgi:hypothetical protein